MVKAILFDCFGVLTTEAWLPFKAEYFAHDPALMGQAADISRQANSGLISHDDFITAIAKLAGISPEETRRYISRNVPNEPLFVYMRQLKPDYKLGLLSNIAANYLGRMFTPEQLGLFDDIALSFEKGFIKPQPEAFEQAAQALNLEPGECVLVDDQERNVTGARHAGMKAVPYKDIDQLKTDLGALLDSSRS